MFAEHILKIDLCHAAGVIANDDRGAANVLEARVFDPQLIGVVGVDGYRGRQVAELIMDQGESSFVFADRGLPLAVKGGVDKRELPGGRGLARQDTVLATVEVKVLSLVRDLMHSREPRAYGKVYVAEKRVLGGVKTNGDRPGIARADLEVDVADSRVEGAWVGVGNVANGRHGSARGRRRMIWRGLGTG